MTPDATVAELKTRVDVLLPTYSVYKYALPPKTTKDDPAHFPHVIISVTDISDSGMDRLTTFTLQVGLHDANYAGQPDVLAVMETLYKYFVELSDISGYQLRLPIRYSLSNEDTRPYYYGIMELTLRSTTYR